MSIADGAVIHSFSHIVQASIGKKASIGPYARLRPGTSLGDGVRIGNFVETKAAVIEAGAKVNHLSYVGRCPCPARAPISALAPSPAIMTASPSTRPRSAKGAFVGHQFLTGRACQNRQARLYRIGLGDHQKRARTTRWLWSAASRPHVKAERSAIARSRCAARRRRLDADSHDARVARSTPGSNKLRSKIISATLDSVLFLICHRPRNLVTQKTLPPKEDSDSRFQICDRLRIARCTIVGVTNLLRRYCENNCGFGCSQHHFVCAPFDCHCWPGRPWPAPHYRCRFHLSAPPWCCPRSPFPTSAVRQPARMAVEAVIRFFILTTAPGPAVQAVPTPVPMEGYGANSYGGGGGGGWCRPARTRRRRRHVLQFCPPARGGTALNPNGGTSSDGGNYRSGGGGGFGGYHGATAATLNNTSLTGQAGGNGGNGGNSTNGRFWRRRRRRRCWRAMALVVTGNGASSNGSASR